MPAAFADWLTERAQALGMAVEQVDDVTSVPAESVDDIVVLGADADLVEQANPALAYLGIMAILMDTPPAENLWLMHALLFANVALVVARPTLADLAAVRHSLTLLLNGLKAEKRLARESIYLVLNQVSERSSFTPRLFQEELGKALEWAPPIAAVIP